MIGGTKWAVSHFERGDAQTLDWIGGVDAPSAMAGEEHKLLFGCQS